MSYQECPSGMHLVQKLLTNVEQWQIYNVHTLAFTLGKYRHLFLAIAHLLQKATVCEQWKLFPNKQLYFFYN